MDFLKRPDPVTQSPLRLSHIFFTRPERLSLGGEVLVAEIVRPANDHAKLVIVHKVPIRVSMLPIIFALADIIKFSAVHCAFITETLLDKDPLAQKFKDQVDFSDQRLARRIQSQVGKVIVPQKPHYSQTMGLGICFYKCRNIVSHLVLTHVWVALVQRPQQEVSLLLLLE